MNLLAMFSRKSRLLRESLGMTQEKFALLLNLSLQEYRAVEDESVGPDLKQALKVLDALKIQPEYFFEESISVEGVLKISESKNFVDEKFYLLNALLVKEEIIQLQKKYIAELEKGVSVDGEKRLKEEDKN